MSKPTQHSKTPGEKKTATGEGKRGRKRKGMCLEDRPILEPNAAGFGAQEKLPTAARIELSTGCTGY
jgi:hypothetical protein